jgi:hypothetical protein
MNVWKKFETPCLTMGKPLPNGTLVGSLPVINFFSYQKELACRVFNA